MSKAIVEGMFQVLEWKDDKAYCVCPGQSMHTGKTAKRDFIVALDKVPSAYCFHSSCSAIVEEVNYKLRRALWDGKAVDMPPLSAAEKLKIRDRMEEKRREEKVARDAAKIRDPIFDKFAWPLADVWEDSPVRPGDTPEADWRLLLSLFTPSALVWIGEPTDSGRGQESHFRSVSQWLEAEPQGRFTCPAVFKDGTFARKNENVESRPFLVVESDTLLVDQMCAIFCWMRQFMTLRAILHTGGKSLHAWYDFPDAKDFETLKIALPELGCDEHLFTPSQPVRIPGVKRGDEWQRLFWFSGPSTISTPTKSFS